MSLDLFTPQIDPSRFNPNFRHVLEWSPYDKAVLNDWADGFIDRDGKFVKEFQTTFNACFWELYLFACLKSVGLPVDFRFSAPDFVVPLFWNNFCIEASISSNADGQVS